MMEQGYVQTFISPSGVGTVTFFHPNHNSLPSRLLQELAAAFTELGHNHEVRVIILKSAQHKTFCAGASFDELAAIQDFQTAHRFFSGFGLVINAMRNCPKIILGCVHGKAVGGGVGLASAVDYCFATQYASVRLSELAVGFGPFVIGPAVERKIGTAAFSQLALSPAEWQSASWAEQKGLFQKVFDSHEDLEDHLNKLAAALCASSPAALEGLKRIFWQGTEHWDTLLTERAAISGELSLSEFSKTAIAAFKAKS